jgi:hypothetical protein
MTSWILTHPYTAGAIFYGLICVGLTLFMRADWSEEDEK